MNIDVSEVRKNRYIILMHIMIYIAMIVYCVMDIFVNGSEHMLLNTAAIVVFGLFFIIEIVGGQIKHEENDKPAKVSKGYYIFRALAVILLAICAFNTLQEASFVIVMMLFSVETVFFLAYDETSQRIMYYMILFALYGLSTTVLGVHNYQNGTVTINGCTRDIFGVLAILFTVIALGEVLSGIWNTFIKKLLSQNRALEDLNDANDALKEHQERISKVNELLGTQKIELQAANKKINRAHDEMSVQSEISGVIAASLEKEDLLNQVTSILQLRLDIDLVAIVLEEDNTLLAPGEEPQGRQLFISTNLGDAFEKNLVKSINETDLTELLSLHKTYIQNVLSDSTKFFAYLTTGQELPSMIYLPIYKQEERLGTLVIGKNKENAFVEGRAFYENITSQLSIGIANTRLYAKMEDMAIRDGLTRIYNRRHLNELVNGYLQNAMMKHTTVSIAMFDIDKFKSVNDTYGHQCGDEVICYVAHILNRKAIQYGGIAGRYGGEEFVVAFEGRTLDESYEIIKEIHNEIKSQPVLYEDKKVEVRASAGLSNFPETCKDLGQLLNRSDTAMYYSKRTGRDRITIDDESISDEIK